MWDLQTCETRVTPGAAQAAETAWSWSAQEFTVRRSVTVPFSVCTSTARRRAARCAPSLLDRALGVQKLCQRPDWVRHLLDPCWIVFS
jgi:hypothetical protein